MSRNVNRQALKIVVLIAIISLLSAAAVAHIDNIHLPEGCGSCHVGHGKPDEPMLSASQEEFCYQCHGSEDKRSSMMSQGKLAATASLPDIEKEFDKPYRHPVEESIGHDPSERLPSIEKSQISHSECVDCHNPHQKITNLELKVDRVSGYSLNGQYLDVAQREYEICLKCHSGAQGSDPLDKNIARQFKTSVRSMHPVAMVASGAYQPSLKHVPSPNRLMNCSDCHRSGDETGPRGPHGSMYEHLLSGNYDKNGQTDESPFAYQFCYSCHDRSSILDNESFPLHEEHIVGDPLDGRPGTSCFTCHASHSSENNPFLIQFNKDVVSPVTSFNKMEYQSTGGQTGRCYLECHGYEHNPGEY